MSNKFLLQEMTSCRMSNYLSNAQLAADFRTDLKHNSGIYMLYQPKISLKTGRTIGVEALLRWHHPILGEVSPHIFMPLIEDSHEKLFLTKLVLQQVVEQIESWHLHGIITTVSINVTASDLNNLGFASDVINLLKMYSLESTSIEIECLETERLTGSENVKNSLHTLMSHGVSIALDDFGCGYSNLIFLKEITVNTVKLDKSLVESVRYCSASRVILEHSINMLRALNIFIIAEGVEDQETLDYLIDYGCDAAQGYYFARPLSRQSVENWLKNDVYKL